MAGVQQCRQTTSKSSTMTGLISPVGDSRSPLSLVTGGGGSPSDSFNHKITGIPCVAAASRYTAPVHIDVGGTIYTSSLETLTRHSDSRLAKMFNGSIPIVLDSLKQHYFIDRDGKMFRHVLNFLRTNRLCLSADFDELELLHEEVRYYDITAMLKALEALRRERQRGASSTASATSGSRSAATSTSGELISSGTVPRNGHHNHHHHYHQLNHRHDSAATAADDNDGGGDGAGYQCLALNISPDLGERIMVSGERALVEEVFPEIAQALMDSRSGVAWNMSDARHVIRFPLNGYCKLNSLQAITRLLNHGFKTVASSGGGVEGQQFSEYLFCRRRVPNQ